MTFFLTKNLFINRIAVSLTQHLSFLGQFYSFFRVFCIRLSINLR
jgi:hypothetical protein